MMYVSLTGVHDRVVLWVGSLSRWSDHLTNLSPFLHVQTTDDHDNDPHDDNDYGKGYANYGTNFPVE